MPHTIKFVGTNNPGESLFVPNERTWSIDQISGVVTFTFLNSSGGKINLVQEITPVSYTGMDANGNISEPATINLQLGFPLPLELLSFDYSKQEETINLNWKTSNEENFDHFELQKSADSKEFRTIAKIKGTKSEFYNFIDTDPQVGLNYYRLKMVDIDGKYNFSKIISVDFDKNGEFLIVENPSKLNIINLSTNIIEPNFSLISLNGQNIDFKLINSENNLYHIKTNGLKKGVYILSLVFKNKLISKKILIE